MRGKCTTTSCSCWPANSSRLWVAGTFSATPLIDFGVYGSHGTSDEISARPGDCDEAHLGVGRVGALLDRDSALEGSLHVRD